MRCGLPIAIRARWTGSELRYGELREGKREKWII